MTTTTINIIETITEKIKDLPLDKQQQILDYVEFITVKYEQEKTEKNQTSQKRIPGLHKGKIWMSDDFNEPMTLEFDAKP